MAQGFEFSEKGLEELERDLKKAINKCPATAKETLKQLAKEFKKAGKKKANAKLKHVNRTDKDKKKAIKAKWGTKIVDENVGMAALIWNSAPHFHLVENGHNVVRGGRVVGFAPGKHIMEETRNDFKDVVPDRFQQMVDDILRGSDLD